MKVSVIIASYNRSAQITGLIKDLEEQDFPKDQFEVCIVDDGSEENEFLEISDYVVNQSTKVKLIRQQNKGQATARTVGVENTTGEIIIILDDDMRLPGKDFIQAYVDYHEKSRVPSVVLGHIDPPPAHVKRPSFELFHDANFERMYNSFQDGSDKPSGHSFYTGNVSLPRKLFDEVGGFDRSFTLMEDRELGLRIEDKTNAEFLYGERAVSLHYSLRGDTSSFMKRCQEYGKFDWIMIQRLPHRTDIDPLFLLIRQSRLRLFVIKCAAQFIFLTPFINQCLLALLFFTEKLPNKKPTVFVQRLVYLLNYFYGFQMGVGDKQKVLEKLDRYEIKEDQTGG